MGDQLSGNPFAALFPSVIEAQQFSDVRKETEDVLTPNVTSKSTEKDEEKEKEQTIRHQLNANDVFERVFLITLHKHPVVPCVFLEDLGSLLDDDQNWLDVNCLDQAVFERIMLSDATSYLIIPSNDRDKKSKEATEPLVLPYLFQSYCRLKSITDRTNAVEEDVLVKCENVIVTHAQMALSHPEILPDQEPFRQLIDLIKDADDRLMRFLSLTVELIEVAHHKENDVSVRDVFIPVLNAIADDLKICSLIDPRVVATIDVLQFFAQRRSLALTFISHNMPQQTASVGRDYESTLLGTLLSISPLPTTEQGSYEFFENPSRSSQAEHENTERILWTPINRVATEIHRMLYSMLRLSPDARHDILSWIGSCLYSKAGRTKLWHMHMNGMLGLGQASDGFLLNLGSVLLRLCRPFSSPNSQKLAHVDPKYCSASSSAEVHMIGMEQETCLVSCEEGEVRPQSSSFGFSTECFFMTHRCLQLGFHVMHERVAKLITELRRLQRVYSDMVQQSGGSTSEPMQNIKTAVEKGTTMYLSARAHMMEPETLDMMLSFYVATATWLVNVAIAEDTTVFRAVSFPLPVTVPKSITCVPEFIVDNVADFIAFLRRFSPRTLEMAGESLDHVMTMILAFMGSPERMKNPHLRAKLAEALESLMPHPEESSPTAALVGTYQRERLFRSHPHVKQLAATLLSVFVSIEMTGQSVAFEQKFNYRRPMYEVLAYIWELDVHREAIKKLSIEAEGEIECPQPPLFLRFINLLINDAIYLLDEGLMHMSSLREHQRRRDTDEFRQLSSEQRQESESNFRHTGMLARFHNVMGKQTIHTLRLITSHVTSIFVHPMMAERIGAMLNYFLLHLVGPKNRTLKVRDMDEYEFRPQDIVTGICHIYINLGESLAFCQAVALDGRSYSAELFVKAEDILCKIGQASLVPPFQSVAVKIKEEAKQLRIKEEALVDAPDEFLDPIMGTLMHDPVTLPSSNVTVDRSTIARHLLSDQSDPFNRSPLTMDMVKLNVELKESIDSWLHSKTKTVDKKEHS